MVKVLNLYACLGGNRLLWDNCKVTAVENNPDLARMYQERFPNDEVVIGDAHQYLLDHYKEFDFIWSSPPCPTHSKSRFARKSTTTPEYPDMKLYQEIIFLKHWFEGKWVVENVKPYYDELFNPKRIGRHLFWSNFVIPVFETKDADIENGKRSDWIKFHALDKFDYKGDQRTDKILRNLVHYETGKRIFDLAQGIIEKKDSKQTDLFQDAETP